MAGSGTTTIDFGAFPGSLYTSVAITGETGIVAGSLVEAWVRPVATADHLADEHIVDPPVIIAADIVAGTGFTIHGRSDNTRLHHGVYSVAWAWT
jgi:hypothetical protein